MPPGNPLGYIDPSQRLALFEMLGIPATDANLGGRGYEYPSGGARYPAELPDQGPPPSISEPDPLAALRQPEVMPTEPKKVNPFQQIALALADALGAKASVLGGGPAPHFTEQLRERREREAGEATSRSERARQERREEAMLGIQLSESEKGRKAQASEAQLGRDLQVRLSSAGLTADWERTMANITSEEGIASAQRGLTEKLAKMEAAREANKGDKEAWQFDEGKLTQLEAMVAGETGTGLDDRLKAMPPDQRTRYIASLRRSMAGMRQRALTEKGAMLIDNYIQTEVEPLLDEYEQMETPPAQAGGPMFRGGTIWPPGGAALAEPLLRLFQRGDKEPEPTTVPPSIMRRPSYR